MTDTRALLMVGLPDSGKSTYVAAVFHTLRAGDGLRFSLRELPDERDYLIELETRWLALKPVGHSPFTAPKRIELPLADTEFGDMDLTIPDVQGEDFREAWERGEWSDDLAALVGRAQGLLLFVRADDVVVPELIEVGKKPPSTPSTKKTQVWQAQRAPTQAKLCDLLEQLASLRGGSLPAIAVVVSAWDTVAEDISADDWLAWKVPLLSQWIRANAGTPSAAVFPVSAQGGDITDAEARVRLSTMSRIERTGGTDQLLAPLIWLLETQ